MTSLSGRPLGTCDGPVAACLTCGEEWPARDAEQASLIVALHGGLRHVPSGVIVRRRDTHWYVAFVPGRRQGAGR